MKNVDVTTTATLRPEILEHTYDSFTKNLFIPHVANYRCVLNIDQIGDDVSPMAVVDVARKFFSDVLWHISEKPNFGNAQRWTWSHTNAEYVFNLEDDWEMLRPVDFADMLTIMEENPTLAHLRLSSFPAKNLPKGCPKGEGVCLRQWNRYIPWNGRFFEVPEFRLKQLGYSNHPSLLRGEFCRKVAIYFHDDWSPEKTLKGRYPELRTELLKWRFGVYHEYRNGAMPTTRDHGRHWRESHNWFKHRGYGFKTWRKKDEAR